jgi:PTH1 family peptidyl-tRNA hydrolase
MDRLIVALGNPGIKYAHTRHNIAWEALDFLPAQENETWKDKFKGQFCSIRDADDKIHFLKPQTFMNLSGESVAPMAKFFKISVENILIIHDELDLPYGSIAFKSGGGLAGHNGLKSSAACLGSQDFKRLRLGIGRPMFSSVSDWVLSGYSSDEAAVFETYMKGVVEALELYMKEGFQKAASKFSKKNILG